MQFEVLGISIDFETKPDLFSPKGLDKGSELLLNSISKINYKNTLDWGCGWGALSLWLSKNQPDSKVTAIDSDIAAVKTAQSNVELNSIKNLDVIASYSFDEIRSKNFDLIVSNPPTHRGREVVDNMIKDSYEHLVGQSKLVLVVEARIKPWVARQMKQVFGNYKILNRSTKHVVLLSEK